MADEKNIEQKDKLWQVAKSPVGGRPRKFKSPQELWNKALEYFRWVDDNPWQRKNASNAVNTAGLNTSNHLNQNVQLFPRAYTLYGLCAYIGMTKWADFKKSYIDRKGFSEVIYAIENIVTAQQVDGAMIHQFDSNLVARLNGIADTTKTEVTGKDGAPIIALPKLTAVDIEELKKLNGL